MDYYTYENDEIQIDLLEIVKALKKKLWLIILTALVFGAAAGSFGKFAVTPQYRSTSMVYVLSKETTLTSLADLQIGSQLTKDYMVMITSRPVLDAVAENLNLDMSYGELRSKISIDNPVDTRILSITVTDSDPVRAKAIVDEVANTSSEYIGDIMEMIPPKIIEEGVVAPYPFTPNVKKYAVLGALLGAVLVAGIVTVKVILNDSIKTEEDIEKYLDLSVLAVVPMKKDSQSKEDKKAKRKRGRK